MGGSEIIGLFAIGIYTGLRLGDCTNLGWGNVDLDKGISSTVPRKTARGPSALRHRLKRILKR